MNTKEEVRRTVEKTHTGVKVSYIEVSNWDYDVNDETGIRDENKKVRYYTKGQVDRNIKALKKVLKEEEGDAKGF